MKVLENCVPHRTCNSPISRTTEALFPFLATELLQPENLSRSCTQQGPFSLPVFLVGTDTTGVPHYFILSAQHVFSHCGTTVHTASIVLQLKSKNMHPKGWGGKNDRNEPSVPGQPWTHSHSSVAVAKFKIFVFTNVARQFVRDKNKALLELFCVVTYHYD